MPPRALAEIESIVADHERWLETDRTQGGPGDLGHRDLRGIDLSGRTLRGIVLTGARLEGAVLIGADLQNANLAGADLSGADLRNAVLNGCYARRTKFRTARMNAAKAQQGRFYYADFSSANLSGADLEHGDFDQAKLEGATLTNADFTGAGLTNLGAAGSKDSFLRRLLRRLAAPAVPLSRRMRASDRFSRIRAAVRGLSGHIGSWWLAVFPYYRPPFRLDANKIAGADISPGAIDPWHVLVRTYTGSRLVFILLFSLVAMMPPFVRVAFWSTVGGFEKGVFPMAVDALRNGANAMRRIPTPPEPGEQWTSVRDRVDRFVNETESLLARIPGDATSVELPAVKSLTRKLDEAAEILREARRVVREKQAQAEKLERQTLAIGQASDWIAQGRQLMALLTEEGAVELKEYRLWEIILARNQGRTASFLVATLLFYNVSRIVLTYLVSGLRDETDRTARVPPWSTYGWWWRWHQIAAPCLLLSVASGLLQFVTLLKQPVLIPTDWAQSLNPSASEEIVVGHVVKLQLASGRVNEIILELVAPLT
ncbi:MAG: pentapeptide repeat-containing protein [Planctomycetes bacterium]|nr:pentapeptide repeat-containing protein [Planctomycetota bacterium]